MYVTPLTITFSPAGTEYTESGRGGGGGERGESSHSSTRLHEHRPQQEPIRSIAAVVDPLPVDEEGLVAVRTTAADDSAAPPMPNAPVIATVSDEVQNAPSPEDMVSTTSLTDPETWHVILKRCFESRRTLADIWKNELMQLVGIETPIDSKSLSDESRIRLAPQLNALGLALKRYNFKDHWFNHYADVLSRCKPDLLTVGVVRTEECLGLR